MKTDKQKEDCYFYTDASLPESEQVIQVMCVGCVRERQLDGWFWEGSRLGYGPFDFICNLCGHVIHGKANVDEIQSSCTKNDE